MKINGIQQLGVGVEDIHEAWDWYRKYFSMDILMFDEEAVAELNLTSTSVFRPSVLLGKRNESRPGEKLLQFAMPLLDFMILNLMKKRTYLRKSLKLNWMKMNLFRF